MKADSASSPNPTFLLQKFRIICDRALAERSLDDPVRLGKGMTVYTTRKIEASEDLILLLFLLSYEHDAMWRGREDFASRTGQQTRPEEPGSGNRHTHTHIHTHTGF